LGKSRGDKSFLLFKPKSLQEISLAIEFKVEYFPKIGQRNKVHFGWL
jgi:hypothetical protein